MSKKNPINILIEKSKNMANLTTNEKKMRKNKKTSKKKQKINKKVIYYLIIFILFLLPFFDYQNWLLNLFTKKYNLGIVNTPSDLIQSWLLVAGVWVACETLKLRKLTTKQIQMQIAPVLVIYFRKNPERITVKNAGNGVALNIKFERVSVFTKGRSKNIKYELAVEDPPILIPDEEREIRGHMYLGEEEVSLSDSSDNNGSLWLIPKYASANFKFTISYSDIENNKYESEITAGKDGIKLNSYKIVTQNV